jgi:hypothetical protein
MSNEIDKEKRGKRILGDEHAIRKQMKIAKAAGVPIEEPHRYVKHHALNCGDPKCIMCSNPRKTFKEKTIQEKRFLQTEGWDD